MNSSQKFLTDFYRAARASLERASGIRVISPLEASKGGVPGAGYHDRLDIAKQVFQIHKADGAGYVRFRKRLTPNGSANRSLQLSWNLQQLLRQRGSSSTGRPQCAPASGGVPVLSGHGHVFSPSLHDLRRKLK